MSAILPSTAHLVQTNSPPQNLVEQGKTLYEAEQFNDAIKILQQAEAAFAASGDKLGEAIAKSNLSLIYQRLGNWTEADKAIAQSLALLQNVKNTSERQGILAQTLDVQGRSQMARGKPEAALVTWEQAANIYQQIGDRANSIRSRINFAQALQSLGQYRRAKEVLTSVQQTLQNEPNSPLKSMGLLRLGDILRVVGDFKASQQVLAQSLAVAKALPSDKLVGEILLSLGNTARAQQNTEAALKYYQQAAASVPTSKRVQLLLNQLSLLVETKKFTQGLALSSQLKSEINKLPPSRVAVYAQINFAQNLARLKQNSNNEAPPWLDIAQILAKAVEQAQYLQDRRAESYAQGTLGWLYEQTGQRNNAQKLTEKALFIAQSIDASDIAYQWQWQLGRLLKSNSDTKGAISSYSVAVKTLQSLRNDLVAINPDVQFSFRESVEPVYRELVELLLQREKNSQPSLENLIQARDLIESLQLAELDNFFRQACLTSKVKLDQVVEQDKNAATIYPIILPHSLEVIIKLPGQKLHHYSTTVAKEEVEKTLDQFSQKIPDPDTGEEIKPLSKQVYDWLIKPAEAILTQSKVNTLVFILDGRLRNIPMATLYDGKQFLIEKYAIALTPGLQLLNPKPLPRRELQILTAGLSQERPSFSALPNVEEELKKISSITKSKVLLNQNFTSKAIQQQIESRPYKIIHLATHGQFSSDAEKTFILAWDKKIKVNELSEFLQSREQTSPEAVELLVLSACQTASGDNRATLGLAGVAVRAGARSTLASLWNLQDESASELMGKFYQELTKTPNITKAEALRRSQLFLLRKAEYSTPIHWAPYVLVGNWL